MFGWSVCSFQMDRFPKASAVVICNCLAPSSVLWFKEMDQGWWIKEPAVSHVSVKNNITSPVWIWSHDSFWLRGWFPLCPSNMETKLLKQVFTRSLLGWPPRKLRILCHYNVITSAKLVDVVITYALHVPSSLEVKAHLPHALDAAAARALALPMGSTSCSLGTPSQKLHLSYHWPLSTDHSPAFLASSCAEHSSAPWVLRHVVAIDVARVMWWRLYHPSVCSEGLA